MQNVLNHASDRSYHLMSSVRGGYYTAQSMTSFMTYLFCYIYLSESWSDLVDTLVLDKSLALHDI